MAIGEVLQNLGFFTIGAGILGWVARFGIKQHFDKELKRYQTELEKDRIRFSELHNKRARKIEEFYEKLIEFEEDMRGLTDPMETPGEPSKDERLQEAANSGNEFVNFYMKNKIYFPPQVCDTVDDIQEEFNSVFNSFKVYRPFDPGPNPAEDIEKWNEGWNRVTEDEVPDLKRDLEEQFRSLLGVESDSESE